jgi:hypothetical protein
MLRSIARYIAPFLLFSAGSLAGAEDWSQLHIGMSAEQAAEALGTPLIKTISNGFELWIYDNHAEALFYGGPLIGWTTPRKNSVPGQTVDVWARKTGVPATPSFILPRLPAAKRRIERLKNEDAFSSPIYRLRN